MPRRFWRMLFMCRMCPINGSVGGGSHELIPHSEAVSRLGPDIAVQLAVLLRRCDGSRRGNAHSAISASHLARCASACRGTGDVLAGVVADRIALYIRPVSSL